ncbi:MAG: cytochrome c-type biogenesis protein [Methylophilaceae bacterium]
MKRLLALFLLLLSLALNAESIASDPLVEARLKSLSQELRCLVCQNQTLADSTAPLAEDLRREIRELIAKGMTDEEITNYLVARYGDFVRYRPPFKSQTALLWLGPTVMLIIGFVVLWVTLRRRNKTLPNDYEVADEI